MYMLPKSTPVSKLCRGLVPFHGHRLQTLQNLPGKNKNNKDIIRCGYYEDKSFTRRAQKDFH